jgi:hypothetical protein
LLVVPTGEIAVTWAPSVTPLRASTVIVAGWPTFTLLTSDSLSATVMVIVLELTISTKGVPEEELVPVVEPELPRPPAVVAAAVLEVLDVLEELLLAPETLDVEPAETESPLERPAVEMIVPLIGAYSLVSASAVLALWTLCSALSTAACAVGMLPADEVEPPEPEPLAAEPPPPALAEPPPPDAPVLAGLPELVVGAELGAVGVGLLAVVVLDELVVVLVVGAVLVPVSDVVVGVVLDVLEGVVVTSETNSVVPAAEGWSDAFVVDELPSAEANWSWAAVRVCWA